MPVRDVGHGRSWRKAEPQLGQSAYVSSSLLVAIDGRWGTSRSMSRVLNVCEAGSDLCRLLPQVKCLTLKSQPRYFVRIARKTGRDVWLRNYQLRHLVIGQVIPVNKGLG